MDENNTSDDPRLEKKILEQIKTDIQEHFATHRQEQKIGIEARSILKSIETETNKLKLHETLSRTDRHYFRARFNYYKLSILRLRSEERDVLEPRLLEFHQEICQREFETGADPNDFRNTPFLEAVKSTPSPKSLISSSESGAQRDQNMNSSRRQSPPGLIDSSYEFRSPPDFNSELGTSLISELSLAKMALKAPLSLEGQEFIAQALERVIQKLKS